MVKREYIFLEHSEKIKKYFGNRSNQLNCQTWMVQFKNTTQQLLAGNQIRYSSAHYKDQSWTALQLFKFRCKTCKTYAYRDEFL